MMDRKGFKIGDKVKLKNPRSFSLGIQTLTIVHFEGKFIKVTWGELKEREFPLYPCEIEYVPRKGEQLLFSFMSEATK